MSGRRQDALPFEFVLFGSLTLAAGVAIAERYDGPVTSPLAVPTRDAIPTMLRTPGMFLAARYTAPPLSPGQTLAPPATFAGTGWLAPVRSHEVSK